MNRRILYFPILFLVLIIIILYRGLNPGMPDRKPMSASVLSEFHYNMTNLFPSVNGVNAEIENMCLRVNVSYNDSINDLISQQLVRYINTYFNNHQIEKSKYNSILIEITTAPKNSISTIYRYLPSNKLNTWNVEKIIINDNSETRSESIYIE